MGEIRRCSWWCDTKLSRYNHTDRCSQCDAKVRELEEYFYHQNQALSGTRAVADRADLYLQACRSLCNPTTGIIHDLENYLSHNLGTTSRQAQLVLRFLQKQGYLTNLVKGTNCDSIWKVHLE